MYSVVDIETTGKSYYGQRITEISIFVFDGKKVVDEFTSLVNPEVAIPPFITNLTGITNAMVRNAPKFHQIAKKVNELTKDTIFVAHNVNFDYNIIRDEFANLGLDWKRKKLCTVRLSRKVIPGLASYSLGNICVAENIPILARHRAKGDAEATVELFRRILERDQNFVVNSFLNPRSKQATLPPLLSKKTVDNLPEKPGVYYFKNEAKKIIYVGKAINLKQRVISHFYDKKKKEQEMCLAIADVSFQETGSELLALLVESSEIKKHYPLYNSAQKRKTAQFGLFSYEDQQGILHLAYNRLKLISNPTLKFTTITEARTQLEHLCETFKLCPKYCHLQETNGPCTHHRINSCQGICSETENVETYNHRVLEAMQAIQLKGKNIVIEQQGKVADEIGFALILDGIYKGFGYIDTQQNEQLLAPEDYLFFTQLQEDNPDTQRILTSYMRKESNTTLG